MDIMSIIIGADCTQVAISQKNQKQVLCFRYGESAKHIALKNSFSLSEDDYHIAFRETKEKTTALDVAIFLTYILLIVKKSLGVFEVVRIAVEPDYLFLPVCDAIPLTKNLFAAFREKNLSDLIQTRLGDIERQALTPSEEKDSFDIQIFDALELRLGMLSSELEGRGVLALAELNLFESNVHLFLPSGRELFCLGTTSIDLGLNSLLIKGADRSDAFSVFTHQQPSTVKVSGMLKSELQDRIAYAIANLWKGKDCYGEGAASFYNKDLDIDLPVGCIAYVGVGATLAGMAKSYRRLLSITPYPTSLLEDIKGNHDFSLSEWMPYIALPLVLLDANVPVQKFRHSLKQSKLKSTLRFNSWIQEQSKKEWSGSMDNVDYEHGLTQL